MGTVPVFPNAKTTRQSSATSTSVGVTMNQLPVALVLLVFCVTNLGCSVVASTVATQDNAVVLSDLSPYFAHAHRELLDEMLSYNREGRLMSVSFGEGWGHLQVIDRWIVDDRTLLCVRYLVIGYEAEAAEVEETLYVSECRRAIARFAMLRDQVTTAGAFVMEGYDDLTTGPVSQWHISEGVVSQCRPPVRLSELGRSIVESHLGPTADEDLNGFVVGFPPVLLSESWIGRFDPHPAVYLDVALSLFDRMNIQRFRQRAVGRERDNSDK